MIGLAWHVVVAQASGLVKYLMDLIGDKILVRFVVYPHHNGDAMCYRAGGSPA